MTLPDLETLSALLRAASAVVDQVSVLSDELLERMARLFSRMPTEDREPILAILEREADLRLARPSGAGSTFALGPPNPNARIYTRLSGPRPVNEPRELISPSIRAARMMLLERARLDNDWEAAMLEAFRLLSPEERAAIMRLDRDVVALLERLESEAPAKAS